MKKKPNFLVILIDDLRFDEFGAGGHPQDTNGGPCAAPRAPATLEGPRHA